MCLPDFIEFKQISEAESLVGYRSWINPIKTLDLKSQYQDYIWTPELVAHEVAESNSGIYSYNNYNYNYYNNYYNNYNYYNYYNYIMGIILQFGKVAIHKTGYRSEYAKVKTLFTIRESDAEGEDKFIKWVKEFNSHIEEIAKKYNAKTIHWQDFKENMK